MITCQVCGTELEPVTDEDALRRAREAYGQGVMLWRHVLDGHADHLPVVSEQ